MKQPAYDFTYAKIIRWLQANGLEMHTPRKGETYVCAKRRRRPVSPAKEGSHE